MTHLYPLRFEPIFRRYLWGGRRLASVLGKVIGEGDNYAESWEVVDHGEDQSVVAYGPLKNVALRDLVSTRGQELFGRHSPQKRFPLLLKFLDCNRVLSVQVHPDDDRARRLDPPDLGKTEVWVVLHADPGGLVYAGLKEGVDRDALEDAIEKGTAESCLHCFEPQPGDCIFIPAGTVHALGAGLVVAEVQQASDTTFRLYDWNRVDADGKARPLHVEQGLDATDFNRGPVQAQTPQPTGSSHVDRLVASDKFVLDRWCFSDQQTLRGDERFHVLAVLDGAVSVEGDPCNEPLVRGHVALLPACAGDVRFDPHGPTTLLDAYLPFDS